MSAGVFAPDLREREGGKRGKGFIGRKGTDRWGKKGREQRNGGKTRERGNMREGGIEFGPLNEILDILLLSCYSRWQVLSKQCSVSFKDNHDVINTVMK